MKSILFLLLLSLGFINLQAQTKNFIDQPYIETAASADTLITPNEIYLSITISESDTKGKVSVEDMAVQMEQKLKALGIDVQKQLSLNDLSSNFKKYFLRSKDVEKTKSYTLLVHTAVMAGKVMMALEDINIGNVKLDRTAYSHPEKIQLILRARAMEKAYQQAIVLTQPLGQKVGNALYIKDQTYNVRPIEKNAPVRIMGFSAVQSAKNEPLDIDFQKVKFQSGVSVRFELLPAAQ